MTAYVWACAGDSFVMFLLAFLFEKYVWNDFCMANKQICLGFNLLMSNSWNIFHTWKTNSALIQTLRLLQAALSEDNEKGFPCQKMNASSQSEPPNQSQ